MERWRDGEMVQAAENGGEAAWVGGGQECPRSSRWGEEWCKPLACGGWAWATEPVAPRWGGRRMRIDWVQSDFAICRFHS
jgi:hypothetical protein